MHIYHDTVWKGVTATVVGIAGTAYGLTMKWLASTTAVITVAPQLVSTPAGPFRTNDLSVWLGSFTTLAGGLWTWYLLKRSETREADRREAQKDADAARDKKTLDGMAEIKLFMAEELAKVQVSQARTAAHLEAQDVMIKHVASAVSVTPAVSGDAAK